MLALAALAATPARASASPANGAAAGEPISSTQTAHPPADDAWSSTTHFGLAVADRSTTGFSRVSGSLVMLDVSRQVSSAIDAGWRTAALGGHGGGRSFYRLGTGPLLSWRIDEAWLLQVAASRFDETSLAADGSKAYHSTGQGFSLGWERTYRLGSRTELAWGGFWSWHGGSVDRPAAALLPGSGSAASTSGRYEKNYGTTRGLEAALRIFL